MAAGQTAYVQELLRDIGFIVLAAWMIVRPRTLLSLDTRTEHMGRT